MRILVVEDEHKLAKSIKKGLEQESFAVDAVYDGDVGLTEALNEPYDAIILDRMLPGSIDGIGIITALRAQNIHTPIIMLTAKDTIADRITGLNAGADDYLIKPFAFSELVARVRAVLRRPSTALDPTLTYLDVQIEPARFIAQRADKELELSRKEFALLEYFMRNPDRILTKDMIMAHVWNYDANILPNTIEVFIGYLRAKIDKPFKVPLIHTVRGFGYRFGSKP